MRKMHGRTTASIMVIVALLSLLTFTGIYIGVYLSHLRVYDVYPPSWMDSCAKVVATRVDECNFQAELRLLASTEHNSEVSARMTRDAFVWHHVASVLIFLVVISAFIAAMYFAYLEFMREDHTTTDPEATIFTAKFLGMEFNSSMIGLSILVMSFAFFLAYLKWVYPITTLGSASSS
jgi:hypothetical protein